MRFTVDKLTTRVAELRGLVYSQRVVLDDWRVRRGPVDGAADPGYDDGGWDVARLISHFVLG